MNLFNRLQKKDGFTIVEITIAIAILSMFALIIGNMLGNLVLTSEASRTDKQVMWLAQYVAEDLKANRGGNLDRVRDEWNDGTRLPDFDRGFEVEIPEADNQDEVGRIELDDNNFWRYDILINERDEEVYALRIMFSTTLSDWEEDQVQDLDDLIDEALQQ